jgi:hypothetical protein
MLSYGGGINRGHTKYPGMSANLRNIRGKFKGLGRSGRRPDRKNILPLMRHFIPPG